MKKKMKNSLLSVLLATTATTAVAGAALIFSPNVNSATAETQTTRFEMVDGASIRFSEPLGMRFIAELGEKEYAELATGTKTMGVFVMQYSDIDTNEDGTIDVTDYAGVSKKLNYEFYKTGETIEKGLYEYVDESGDTYYRANAVIDLSLKNYAKEFVGVGYIAETKNGVTTYEYTDISYDDNVRTAAYVAIEAHADPDYADVDNAMRAFTQYIDGAQLYSAYSVTENDAGKYVYNDAEYDTLAEIKGTIENYAYGISLDKSVKYVKADGTAQLSATLSDTLNNVTFKGAHAVYRSSDESVVKVDKTGKLTHIKNGTATITAEFMGKTQTCEVISGAIDFNDNKLPSYVTEGGRATVSVVDGALNVKAQDTSNDENNNNNARAKLNEKYMDAMFEDEDIAYMAFDLKFASDFDTTKGSPKTIYYRNYTSSVTWTTYCDYSYNESYETAPIGYYQTYYYPRSAYEACLTNNVGDRGVFVNVGMGILEGGEGYYVDNIRAVTAEEKAEAYNWYSFEYGGIRNNTTQALLYAHVETGTWQLNINNIDASTAKYTSEIVSDGCTALSFTKKSGNVSLVLNHNTESAMEKEIRNAGYIAYDLYVPEGSDAYTLWGSYKGTTLSKGWNTIYAQVDATDNNITYFSDTTNSTYVIDNIRFITADEYFANAYDMENGGSTIRNDNAAGTAGVFYWYAGADRRANTYSIAVTGSPVDPNFNSEIVHSGDYSLSFTKSGNVNLQFRADTEAYANLKNGFSFWIYSTVAINGTGTGNFNNGNDTKPNGGAGYFINANTWTQIVLTADDIVQGTDSSACCFLRIAGSTNGTYYFDGFQPLEGNTVTLDAGVGSVESSTITLYTGVSYTLETPTYNEYLYEFVGWYNGDELVPTTGVWNIAGDVTLTAKYEDATQGNFYKATYENISEDGTVSGLTLQASTHTNASTGVLPQPTDTEDMSYYRFNGEYGLNDFLVFDFTGNNMPIISFFNTEVTNTVYNHAENAGVKGWIFANGMTRKNGEPYGGWAGAHANRLAMIGPYKINYTFDDNGKDTALTQLRANEGSATSPNSIAMSKFKDSTDEYRMIIGWVENGSNMNLRIVVWDLTTGSTVYDANLNKSIPKADWEGDIVLYGHFGKATTVNKVYPIVEGFDNARAKYMPAYVTYNTTTNSNQITLGAGTYSGNVTRPNVGSTDMSYIAFNGSYGVGDYVVFDFTGENMPIVSFFNNMVTNTVYNNASVASDVAGVKDANAHGIVICGGMYKSDKTSGLGGIGTANACRLIVVGNQKVLGWDDNSNAAAGGYRTSDGSATSPNPLSITALQGVTDTYRVIMGFSAAGSLEVRVINMVTGAQIYSWTRTGLTSKLGTGSIALHGQFGKTTVLNRVFGVEENTTIDALITKYAKDTDYSDEDPVVLSRYGYSSISDGTYTIDSVSYCATCGTAISDSHAVCKDFRNDPNSYTVYKNAGFNVMLPQSAVNDSVAAEVKTHMENAAAAGLKVILTDWQLQILSTPIRVTSTGPVSADATYKPWILASDASATEGLAYEWLTQLEALGITADTTRFADRAALDTYVKGQLESYSSYEAFLGVMLGDEPSYHNAYCYGEIYQSIKRVMPECYVQYNLLPLEQSISTIQYRYPGLTSSSSTADIENAYKQYVELFVDALGTDYIQYDDYPFKSATEGSWFWETTTPYIDNTSLRNIQLIAEIAKERGLDVKVVTQAAVMRSGGSDGNVVIRQVTENDARWLNNYLMGFGVKQINYFTYWTKSANSSSGEWFDDGGSFVNRDGSTTAVYDVMKMIMAENDSFSKVIGYFDYNESKVVGSNNDSNLNNDHITWNNSAVVNADASFRLVSSVTTDKEFTLVTELYDKENYNYMYMVMNTIDPNYGGTQSVTVTFADGVTSFYVYQPDGTSTVVTGNTYTVSLTAGQAVYLMPKF